MTVKIKNIRLEISFWFAAVLTLLTVLLPDGRAAACFAFCVLHEVGHLAMIAAAGVSVKKIALGYFGMRIETRNAMPSRGWEIAAACSGPAVNVILGAVCRVAECDWAAVMNFVLAAFNLLPVPMLDGGRILAALIRDDGVCKKIGVAFCAVLVASGAVLAAVCKNFTLLITSLYILTGTVTAR